MSRSLLVFLILIIGASVYFKISDFTEPSAVLPGTENLHTSLNKSDVLKTNTSAKQHLKLSDQLTEILISTKCPENTSNIILDLTESNLRKSMQNQPDLNETLHWENYHFKKESQAYVLHLVPSEETSGQENWSVKLFRDEDEGPSFISEKKFMNLSAASKEIKNLLPAAVKKTQRLSWVGREFSLHASIQDQVFDFKFQNSHFVLECSDSSCRCF